MGSTHPPLESLLTFSQNCLEGFEHSRLNRISILRKEIHQIFEELIESEIDARLARWILDDRQVSGPACSPHHAIAAEVVLPELALRSLARSPGGFVAPSDDAQPPEFPFGSMLELRDDVTLELRLPFRRVPVSEDASAALRSLEHFARCKARCIGDDSIDLLICHAPGLFPSCQLLPFPALDALQMARTVSSPISDALSSQSGSEHYSVRQVSPAPINARAAMPRARPRLHLIPRLRRRLATSVGRWSSVVGSSRSHFPRLPPVRISLPQSSLGRAAVFVRN